MEGQTPACTHPEVSVLIHHERTHLVAWQGFYVTRIMENMLGLCGVNIVFGESLRHCIAFHIESLDTAHQHSASRVKSQCSDIDAAITCEMNHPSAVPFIAEQIALGAYPKPVGCGVAQQYGHTDPLPGIQGTGKNGIAGILFDIIPHQAVNGSHPEDTVSFGGCKGSHAGMENLCAFVS